MVGHGESGFGVARAEAGLYHRILRLFVVTRGLTAFSLFEPFGFRELRVGSCSGRIGGGTNSGLSKRGLARLGGSGYLSAPDA